MKQRYRIEGKLGEGGMGVVYRAVHLDLNRPVALKYLLAEADLSPSSVARFKREMDVLMSLSHPGVIRVFDAGEADGKLFYAMELVEASDLGQLLKEHGALAPALIVSVLDQLLDALDYIHARGLIHRDIKPANIMVEPGGRAILMDFGLVRPVDGTMLTAEGKLVGTPRYFPPETMRGEPATSAGDLWSLGVCAYEMLCAERPFNAGSLTDLAMQILRDPAPPLEGKRPGLPAPLVELVHRMLEKDPAHRIATAREARDRLRAAMDAKEAGAAGRTAELARPTPPGRLPGRGFPLPGRTTSRSPALRARDRPSRVSASVPAEVPRVAARSKLVLASIITVCGLAGAGLFRALAPGVASPPRAALPAAPERLAAQYAGLDRIVVTFRTAAPTLWQLDAGGARPVVEAAPATEHRIEVPAGPASAPPRLVLIAPGVRRDVELPDTPVQRVERLRRALQAAGLEPAATDRLWTQLRKRIPGWSVVGISTFDGRAPVGGISDPSVAQEAVRRDRTIARPLEQYVEDLRKRPAVAAHLEDVLALARPLLARADLPAPAVQALLDVLCRLDLLDALAEYVGLPQFFGIQDRAAPALAITAEDQGLERPAFAPGAAVLFRPEAGWKGVSIYARGEDPKYGAGDSLVAANESSMSDRDSAYVLRLGDAGAPGRRGRRLDLWIYGLSPQYYVWLVPDGWTAGLPVRLRGTFHGLTHMTRFVVNLDGALSQPRVWRIEMRRVFMLSSRLYYGVDGATSEPLD